jgi:hypothetical protein
MPVPLPSNAKPLPPRSVARLAQRWAILSSLPLLLTACVTPQERIEFIRPSPPPANLAADCLEGPDYPAGDLPLGEVLEIAAGREKAAADCRLRHRGLAGWAEAVTRGDLDGGRLDH